MTLITYTMLLACVMALLLSIGALLVAVRLLLLSRSTSSHGLSVRLSEVESTCEALTARLRGLNSRISMQLLREKRRASTEPTENDDPQAPPDAEAEAKRIRDELNAQLAERKFQ